MSPRRIVGATRGSSKFRELSYLSCANLQLTFLSDARIGAKSSFFQPDVLGVPEDRRLGLQLQCTEMPQLHCVKGSRDVETGIYVPQLEFELCFCCLACNSVPLLTEPPNTSRAALEMTGHYTEHPSKRLRDQDHAKTESL